MKNFKFYQNEKITIWERHFFTISAESEEGAREIASKFTKQSIFTNNACNCHENSELIFETAESLTPSDNSGYATLELYDWDNKLLGNNDQSKNNLPVRS